MSRTPEFLLKVMDKVTDAKSGKLGCAWVNEDGSLTIQVDPDVTLSHTSTQVIKLFPNDRLTTAPTAGSPPEVRNAAGTRRAGRSKTNMPSGGPRMADLPTSVRHSLMTGKEKES